MLQELVKVSDTFRVLMNKVIEWLNDCNLSNFNLNLFWQKTILIDLQVEVVQLSNPILFFRLQTVCELDKLC